MRILKLTITMILIAIGLSLSAQTIDKGATYATFNYPNGSSCTVQGCFDFYVYPDRVVVSTPGGNYKIKPGMFDGLASIADIIAFVDGCRASFCGTGDGGGGEPCDDCLVDNELIESVTIEGSTITITEAGEDFPIDIKPAVAACIADSLESLVLPPHFDRVDTLYATNESGDTISVALNYYDDNNDLIDNTVINFPTNPNESVTYVSETTDSPTFPPTPSEGDTYINDSFAWTYDGTTWVIDPDCCVSDYTERSFTVGDSIAVESCVLTNQGTTFCDTTYHSQTFAPATNSDGDTIGWIVTYSIDNIDISNTFLLPQPDLPDSTVIVPTMGCTFSDPDNPTAAELELCVQNYISANNIDECPLTVAVAGNNTEPSCPDWVGIIDCKSNLIWAEKPETVLRTQNADQCLADSLTHEGVTWAEGYDNQTTGTESHTGNYRGVFQDINFRGEHDAGEVGDDEDTLTPGVSGEIHVEETKDGCDVVTKIWSSAFLSDRILVDDINGDDAAAVAAGVYDQRTPFKTIQGAWAASDKTDDLIEVVKGVYSEGTLSVNAGQTFNMEVDDDTEITWRLFTNGGNSNVSGQGSYFQVGPGTSIFRNNHPNSTSHVHFKDATGDFPILTYAGVVHYEFDAVYGTIYSLATSGSIKAYIDGDYVISNASLSAIHNNSEIAANYAEMWVDVKHIQGQNQNGCLYVLGNAVTYARVNYAENDNGPSVRVMSDAANTMGGEMNLISGRYLSRSPSFGVVGFNSSAPSITECRIHAGSVLIHEGTHPYSVSLIGGGTLDAQNLRLYSVVSMTKPIDPVIDLVHGTPDVSPNVQ